MAQAAASPQKSRLIIAIDGPVGSGKSTIARTVARMLGYAHLDSGAMYRAIAWKALQSGVPLDASDRLGELARAARIALSQQGEQLHVSIDGQDVTEAIRSPEVTQAASLVAVVPAVRECLVDQQRAMGQAGGVVMEGRDIGTVVFPGAELKIFLDAAAEVRAERRRTEYLAKGRPVELAPMLAEVRERDRRDRERAVSPLRRADDAVLVDNTAMDAEETARVIVMLAKEKTSSTT